MLNGNQILQQVSKQIDDSKMFQETNNERYVRLTNNKKRCGEYCTGEIHIITDETGKCIKTIRCPNDVIAESKWEKYLKKLSEQNWKTLKTWKVKNDKYYNLITRIINDIKLKHPVKNLIFQSEKNGNGKTHLAMALHYEAIKNHIGSMFLRANILRRNIVPTDSEYLKKIDNYKKVKILIIDDIGAGRQFGLDYYVETLEEIIEMRNQKKIIWCVTMNLNPAQLKTIFGVRLADRLMENADIIPFDSNKSYRLTNTQIKDYIK